MSNTLKLANFSGMARLFPLPNLVMFPQVLQGLHIFEPRYRELMGDALADDGLMALVLLKPNAEADREGRPAIESVACLGRVSWYDKQQDGTYNLCLQGLSRIRIREEVPGDRSYRSARVDLMADRTSAEPAELVDLRKRLLAQVLPFFEANGKDQSYLRELFEGEMPLGEICDILAYALNLPVEIKQSLLAETQVELRAATIATALQAASSPRGRRRFPPDFSSN